MPHARISTLVLVAGLFLFLQPVCGQKRKVDVRALWGYAAGLEDTPPHAWVGGGAVTAAVGPRLRLGVEALQANMFGKYSDFKERATLVTPLMEFEFSPGRRFNPYLAIGVGYTRYRALEPNPLHFFDPSLPESEWRNEGGFNLAGGAGIRLFMTERFFAAPELRIGLIPFLRSTVSLGYVF